MKTDKERLVAAVAAIRAIVDNWERGDLCGAVNHAENIACEIEASLVAETKGDDSDASNDNSYYYAVPWGNRRLLSPVEFFRGKDGAR